MISKLIYFVRSKGEIYYNWYVLFCPSSPPSDHLCRTWPPSLLASSLPRSLLFFIGIFKVIFIIAIVFTTCPHGGGKQPCKRPCSSAGRSQTGDSSFILECLEFRLINRNVTNFCIRHHQHHLFAQFEDTLSGFDSSYLVRSRTCLVIQQRKTVRHCITCLKTKTNSWDWVERNTCQAMCERCAEVKKSSLSLWMYLSSPEFKFWIQHCYYVSVWEIL